MIQRGYNGDSLPTTIPKAVILIVEDEVAIRECLVQTLQLEGYQVSSACNGQEALEFLAKTPYPCLILLDLMMPIMNGWQFLEKIEHGPHAPVIVSSAAVVGSELKGVVELLRKPYQLEDVLSLVRKYCGSPSHRS